MKLALVLGASNLNFLATLSKLDMVLQQNLEFLKGMFGKDRAFIVFINGLFIFFGSG